MSDPVVEVTRRVAHTEAGKQVMAWEKFRVLQYAYGTVYLSLMGGREFSRMRYVVCGEDE